MLLKSRCPDGTHAVIDKGFEDAKRSGVPLVGLIMTATLSPFPVQTPGQLVAVVEMDGESQVLRESKFHFFAHRAAAARFAIVARFSRERALARARPPFRPKEAAAGSFPCSSGVGSRSSIWPVAIPMMLLASWLGSRGRFFTLRAFGVGASCRRRYRPRCIPDLLQCAQNGLPDLHSARPYAASQARSTQDNASSDQNIEALPL